MALKNRGGREELCEAHLRISPAATLAGAFYPPVFYRAAPPSPPSVVPPSSPFAVASSHLLLFGRCILAVKSIGPARKAMWCRPALRGVRFAHILSGISFGAPASLQNARKRPPCVRPARRGLCMSLSKPRPLGRQASPALAARAMWFPPPRFFSMPRTPRPSRGQAPSASRPFGFRSRSLAGIRGVGAAGVSCRASSFGGVACLLVLSFGSVVCIVARSCRCRLRGLLVCCARGCPFGCRPVVSASPASWPSGLCLPLIADFRGGAVACRALLPPC